MGRRKQQYSHCVPRRWAADQYPFADDPNRGMVEHWCGEKRLWERDKPFDSPRLATCLKCAQAIGKAKLGQIAARLRLERRETPLGYDKSTYDVFIDGTLRAHVGIANGWGEKWYLAKVGDPADSIHWTNGRHGGVVSGSVADHFTAQTWPMGDDSPHTFWPVHFAARDAMACAALAYWERYGVQGLPTVEEAKAARAERKQREEAERIEREAARAERERQRQADEDVRLGRMIAWRLALESLEARGDLSNVERAGIEAAKALGWN